MTTPGKFRANYHSRLFYSLGGGVEKNQLFGTVGTPRLGLAYYPVRPGKGVFTGRRYGSTSPKASRSHPSMSSSRRCMTSFWASRAAGEAIQQYHISPIVEEQSRTYEGGVAQSFLSERGLLRVGYFHNQYTRQIEPVPATEVSSSPAAVESE